MHRIVGSANYYPARATLAGYSVFILLGSAVLCLPICHVPDLERPITFLDALFTSTSAACVTGLTVRSTGHEFSLWGQLAILALIQFGGLGIMTFTTLIIFQLGSRGTLRQRALIESTLGGHGKRDVRNIIYNVIRFTFVCEGLGVLILIPRFLWEGLGWPGALWHAVFHSISAFCNAGFGLHDDNLMRYQGDVIVNVVIGVLIVVGGLGFPVVFDLRKNRRQPTWSGLWEHLQLHSKIMLLGTVALISFGAISFAILESGNVLKGKGIPTSILICVFQSITCRTAGFNTVDIGSVTNAMAFVMIVLMVIGAGPCSTAGGFKVSTGMTLVLRAWATFGGHHRVTCFRRTIPQVTTERAGATAMLFLVTATLALTFLLISDQARGQRSWATSALPETTADSPQGDPATVPRPSDDRFLESCFEVASALGTVGLTMGLTTELTPIGRIIVILLMFLGRLGPISVFAALSFEERDDLFEYPSEEPLLG